MHPESAPSHRINHTADRLLHVELYGRLGKSAPLTYTLISKPTWASSPTKPHLFHFPPAQGGYTHMHGAMDMHTLKPPPPPARRPPPPRCRPRPSTVHCCCAALLALCILLYATAYLFDMWTPRLFYGMAGAASSALAAVDVSWYPSSQTAYNNLTSVAGGTGVPRFTFDPSGDWVDGEYNWCNMPHVRADEYVRPEGDVELVYVELMHRHHKRTPYSSNAFPIESYRWDCDDQGLFYYNNPVPPASSSSSAARTYWQGTVSSANPFVPSGWIGTCQFPQITLGGLIDSHRHGADLYAVYHDLLGFLPSRDTPAWRDAARYRVTQNVITSQVAGMVVAGTWGLDQAADPVPLTIQAAGVDSLEPQYTCAAASSLFSAIQTPATSKPWADHLAAATQLYAALDDISGVPATDSGFHKSLDHYYDNLSARQCHAKPLPCKLVNGANETSKCVTQALADTVYRFGHWEYAHVYRGSKESLAASAASIGVWVAELAGNLRAAAGNTNEPAQRVLLRHNVAHDGSVSRLLSVLQLDEMVWPGMGAEVVFELWRRKADGGYVVRTLFGGKVLRSASPTLGAMDMIPLEKLLAYFDGLVGMNAGLIVGKCNGTIPM